MDAPALGGLCFDSGQPAVQVVQRVRTHRGERHGVERHRAAEGQRERESETGAHIGDVDGQRPDVGPRQALHRDLILDGVADDVDDEALALQVQRERPRQRQRRRPGHHHHLAAAAGPRAPRAPRLAAAPTPPVRAVRRRPAAQHHHGHEQLVAPHPRLHPLERRRRQRRRGGRGGPAARRPPRRQPRAHRLGDPRRRRQLLPHYVGDLVDLAVDVLGHLGRVPADLGRER